MDPFKLPKKYGRKLTLNSSIDNDLMLLEVDEKLLEKVLQNRVEIKGCQGSESAVLCSEDQTYLLKTVDTTNTVWVYSPEKILELDADKENAMDFDPTQWDTGLSTQIARDEQQLVPDGDVRVHACAPRYIEVEQCAPRLGRIKEVLSGHMLSEYDVDCEHEGGMEIDDDQTQPGCSFKQLLAEIEASTQEIIQELKRLRAVMWKREVRLVSPSMQTRTLLNAVATCVENDWPVSSIPAEALAKQMTKEGIPYEFVQNCIQEFSTEEFDDQMYKDYIGSSQKRLQLPVSVCLDATKVCRHFARQILTAKPQLLSKFKAAWRDQVPECFTPDIATLGGLAHVRGNYVMLLDAEVLPLNGLARFATLFEIQPKWTREQLDPYLTGIKEGSKTSDEILLKYTRASQNNPDDPIVYTRR